jgi:hypothetical protein
MADFANLSFLLMLKMRYNRPLSFGKTIRLMRLKMTLGTKMEKYHGVRCHSCGETIPVPARIANKQSLMKQDVNSASAEEPHFPTLNLRCRVCQKENFYKISDVLEVEDITDRSAARKGPAPHRLPPQGKMYKTANE